MFEARRYHGSRIGENPGEHPAGDRPAATTDHGRPVSGKRRERPPHEADDPERSEEILRRTIGDVEPLDGPQRVVPRQGRRPGARRVRAPVERVPFSVERIGTRIAGLAPGGDPTDLARLRGGEIAPDLALDLHGFDETEARGMVRDTLRRARKARLRCVKVIHGRGLRSGGDAVLKEALPEWIEEPPLGQWVSAYASSPSRHGGPGSTLILLYKVDS